MNLSKIIWMGAAIVSFVLGTLGTFLPILPTVPLYLLAAFGFANSSERLHKKFVASKLYMRHLDPYLKAGGLTLKAKLILVAWVTFQLGLVAVIFHRNIVLLLIIGTVYLGFVFSMRFAVKTVSVQTVIRFREEIISGKKYPKNKYIK